MVALSFFELFYWPNNLKKYENHERFLAILSINFKGNIAVGVIFI